MKSLGSTVLNRKLGNVLNLTATKQKSCMITCINEEVFFES